MSDLNSSFPEPAPSTPPPPPPSFPTPDTPGSFPAPPQPGYGTSPSPLNPPVVGSYAVPPTPFTKPRKGMAIAAMVLGIAGLPLFLFIIFSLLAIIFGWIALRKTGKLPELHGGKGMAIAGLATGVIGLGLGAWFWVANADKVKEAAAGFDAEIGECVKIPDGTTIAGLPTVPCDKPHPGEVVARGELPDQEWPGLIEIQNQAAQKCFEEFRPYVGHNVGENGLDVFFVAPNEARWKAGDQFFICVGYKIDKTDLPAGSLKGTG